jgi:glutamate racemase
MSMPPTQPTIGVFDSGFGGLTVLRALRQLLPDANYIYLGDTARLPYGSKSHQTIARYAVSSAKFLHEQGAELLVVACNTATALALKDIQHALPIPVIGVVEPGAHAAHRASNHDQARDKVIVIPSKAQSAKSRQSNFRTNHVLVLATAATVQSHAYTQALNTLGLEAHEKACPLLVPLVEEGWINHPVTEEVLKIYLTEALNEAPKAQTLLLGCTHYPLLEPAIRRALTALNHPLTIIDSAEATAQTVVTHLGLPAQNSKLKTTGSQCTFYATDSIEKFERLGSAFLGQPLTGVRHVDLGG